MHPSNLHALLLEEEIYREQQSEIKVAATVERFKPKEPYVDKRAYMFTKLADNKFKCSACGQLCATRLAIVNHFTQVHVDSLNGAHYVFTDQGSVPLQTFKRLHRA